MDLLSRIEGDAAEWVSGDAARLRQVLLNLLNNAIKFTEKGFVTATAETAREADRLHVRFAVRDTGIGISEEDRHKLFERFSQADSSISRRFGGTGLGLAISQRIVEAMHGTIGVDSTPGQGSTFWFTLSLPLASAPIAEVAASTAGPAWRELRILVVDDHEMNRDLARTVLQKAGHPVETAESGDMAVRKAREGTFDTILMDIQMPGMDGIEASRQIRALGGSYANVPIIAMTANVMVDQVAQYLAAGMVDHVAKPIDTKRLLQALAKWTQPALPSPPAFEAEISCSPDVHDPSVWDEFVEMMGRQRVHGFAANLRAVLLADCWVDDGGSESGRLAAAAHACVAFSGQLGFGALSVASRNLETACLTATDVQSALADFGLARLHALATLERLLSEPPVAFPLTAGDGGAPASGRPA